MLTRELNYELPPELIAQRPAEPRDASRLMVLHRGTQRIEHRVFHDIGEYLRPNDCLVVNDTRVIPARFFCQRASGGKIEALFLREAPAGWRVLLKPSARLKVDESLLVASAPSTTLTLLTRHERGEWTVQPNPPVEAFSLLDEIGEPPLPPYIRREQAPDARDRERYQTVYARRAGAVAAPTAGLHFTPELLSRLSAAGVRQAYVTLHVGLGTFAPIEVEDLARHRMHAEWYSAPAETLAAIEQARAAGGRIVAVGTTSARVLESLRDLPGDGRRCEGWTDVFLYPPYAFQNVDALLTNFHLPGSTLLALIMALAGKDFVREAYAAAIAERYRFYSFGDAMLIL